MRVVSPSLEKAWQVVEGARALVSQQRRPVRFGWLGGVMPAFGAVQVLLGDGVDL